MLKDHIRRECARGCRRTPPPIREPITICSSNKSRLDVAQRILNTSGQVILKIKAKAH